VKKGLGFVICIILFHGAAIAQTPGEWTWMTGDSIFHQPANFGIQGVPSPTNKPSNVYEGCEWVDNSGNFWIYGGCSSTYGVLADMWKFDPSTNEWTWMNGPGGFGGVRVCGIKGVAAATNHPGPRGWGMLSWLDTTGNFWMFGGYDTAFFGDFWKYEPAINMWTWMGGDTTLNPVGNFGIMGVPAPTNTPRPSCENACSWVAGNTLWFYGGQKRIGGLSGDLWRYDISTDMWTWMKGDTTNAAPPVFGILGVSSPTNFPGARWCYTRWKDNNGDFWIFGGGSTWGFMNDLWRYSISTNEWTWMNGPNYSSDPGSYGSKCVAMSSNVPRSREECRASWTDDCGNFWLFGGLGPGGDENDLWRYDMNTDMWTWVGGDSVPSTTGVYGTKGVSDPANFPGARTGSLAFKSVDGNLWLYGGYDVHPPGGLFNDLWRFVPDTTCAGCLIPPVAIFSAPNQICPGTCIDILNNSQNASAYAWSFPGANPPTSTDANPTNICYYTPGTYQISLIASNSIASDTLTMNNFLTVYPFPPAQAILQSGDTLFANQAAVSYQWFYNGNIIPGATDYYYVASQSGNYNVVATDINDCEVEAAIYDVIASVQNISAGEETWVTPNPFTGEIKVMLTGRLSVFDNIGQKVFEKEINDTHQSIDLSGFSNGIYFIRLETGEKILQQKLVKM
jgi:hypothetical protein